jgi:hypothetical protein
MNKPEIKLNSPENAYILTFHHNATNSNGKFYEIEIYDGHIFLFHTLQANSI